MCNMPSNYFWINFICACFLLCSVSLLTSDVAQMRSSNTTAVVTLDSIPCEKEKETKHKPPPNTASPGRVGAGWLAWDHEGRDHYQTQIHCFKSVRVIRFTRNTCHDPRLSKALACFQLFCSALAKNAFISHCLYYLQRNLSSALTNAFQSCRTLYIISISYHPEDRAFLRPLQHQLEHVSKEKHVHTYPYALHIPEKLSGSTSIEKLQATLARVKRYSPVP